MSGSLITRRRALWLGAAPLAGLAACDPLNNAKDVRKVVDSENTPTRLALRVDRPIERIDYGPRKRASSLNCALDNRGSRSASRGIGG